MQNSNNQALIMKATPPRSTHSLKSLSAGRIAVEAVFAKFGSAHCYFRAECPCHYLACPSSIMCLGSHSGEFAGPLSQRQLSAGLWGFQSVYLEQTLEPTPFRVYHLERPFRLQEAKRTVSVAPLKGIQVHSVPETMADNGGPHYITATELALPSSAHEVRCPPFSTLKCCSFASSTYSKCCKLPSNCRLTTQGPYSFTARRSRSTHQQHPR